MHLSTLAKRVYFFLFLAFVAFYLYGLGSLPLLGPDEPRYAQVAREMLLRRDLITPTLGGHTWFEKPALLYWMVIAAFKVFGVSEWSARLGPALCGLLTIAAVWVVARSVERTTISSDWNGYAWLSALITASCLGLIVFSRGLSFDIVITMTTVWALGFFFCFELAKDKRKQAILLIGFYCFIGLSLLAKGLVGLVIPFGVVGFYYVLRGAWPRRIMLLSLLWGIPLALLVSAVWYGPVIYKHGWSFIDEFFVQHHFARYTSNKYHHPQPIYFYPAILLMLTVPWTPFLIGAFIGARNWSWRSQDSGDRLFVLLVAWILFPIIFFSFSGSKLPGYILPVLPAALLLVGAGLTPVQVARGSHWTIKATGALWFLMGLIGLVYGLRVERLSVMCTLLASSPFIVAGLFTVLWNRSLWTPIFAISCSVLLAVVFILNCVAVPVTRRESTRELLALADARGYSTLMVLALRGDDRSAEFYASGRVVYGTNGQVTPLDEAAAIIAATRQRQERILAFIPAENLNFFKGQPGIEVLGDNGKLALLCLY